MVLRRKLSYCLISESTYRTMFQAVEHSDGFHVRQLFITDENGNYCQDNIDFKSLIQ